MSFALEWKYETLTCLSENDHLVTLEHIGLFWLESDDNLMFFLGTECLLFAATKKQYLGKNKLFREFVYWKT